MLINIQETIKKRYEENKEFKNKKTDCECGGSYNYTNKTRHIKTARHQKHATSLKASTLL